VSADTLLEVSDLTKYFPIRGGVRRKVVGQSKVVDGVSFTVRSGDTLGIVGESGCGKTTIGRLIMRILAADRGRILFRSDVLPGEGTGMVDLARLDRRSLKELRTEIQMVFQDPFSSLNPRMTVGDILAEPFAIHRLGTKSKVDDRVSTSCRSSASGPSSEGGSPTSSAAGSASGSASPARWPSHHG
jgi:ABC-type oligopeptide transport system ATPase subunit